MIKIVLIFSSNISVVDIWVDVSGPNLPSTHSTEMLLGSNEDNVKTGNVKFLFDRNFNGKRILRI